MSEFWTKVKGAAARLGAKIGVTKRAVLYIAVAFLAGLWIG